MNQKYGHWYDGQFYYRLLDRLDSPLHRRLVAAVPAGASVLDIGCGSGGVSLGLAKKCRKVVGVDASERMIRAAEKRLAKSGLNNVCFGETEALEFLTVTNEKFDFIILSLVLHEMSPHLRAAVLENSRRAADKLVIQDYATPIKSPYWRFVTRLIERMTSPAHYRNFCDFQNSGGLLPLLKKHGYRIESDRINRQGFLRITVAVPD